MDNYFNTPEIQAAQTASTQANQNASTLAAGAATLPDQLRSALTQKFSTNNPLYANRETATKNFLTTYTQAPLDYTAKSAGGNSDVVYNPLQQQNLIQARRAGALAPLTTANSQLAVGTGGIDNVIDATGRAFGAQVTAAQGDAQNKRQSYEDLISQASAQAQQAQKALEMAMQQQQFEKDLGYKYASLGQEKQLGMARINASKVNQKQVQDSLTQAKAIQEAMASLNGAEQSFKKSGSGAQYAGGDVRSYLPDWLFGFGEAPANTKSAFSQANQSLFDIAGKAFTGSEKKLLEGKVLDIAKNPQANQSAINQVKQALTNKLLQLQGTISSATGGSGDWN